MLLLSCQAHAADEERVEYDEQTGNYIVYYYSYTAPGGVTARCGSADQQDRPGGLLELYGNQGWSDPVSLQDQEQFQQPTIAHSVALRSQRRGPCQPGGTARLGRARRGKPGPGAARLSCQLDLPRPAHRWHGWLASRQDAGGSESRAQICPASPGLGSVVPHRFWVRVLGFLMKALVPNLLWDNSFTRLNETFAVLPLSPAFLILLHLTPRLS